MRRRRIAVRSRFLQDEDGTASVEYVVVLGLIVIAIIGVAAFGQGLLSLWQKNGQRIQPVL